MDLQLIKEISDSDYSPNIKEELILRCIADDKESIPYMLRILQIKREDDEELKTELNLELSRAFVALEVPTMRTEEHHKFVTGEIRKHYLKWQHKLRCCFKMEGLK